MEVKEVVFVVSVCPKTALPVMETVPDNAAVLVLNAAIVLAGDAKCVAVSAKRASKL